MIKTQREQQILNLLTENDGFLDVLSICEKLFTSQSSVRRDLKRMESAGLIERTHGGARLNENFSTIINFNERFAQNSYEKTIIAKKAVSLISDNSVIFLDQSTTAFFLAKELPNKSTLTVITNNVEILRFLSNTQINVICSGGQLFTKNRNCLIGIDAENIFIHTFADFAFFSCKALSADGIISDCSREEVVLRNCMLKNAKQKVFLCDKTKYNSRSTFTQCNLSSVDYLISDIKMETNFPLLFPRLTVL